MSRASSRESKLVYASARHGASRKLAINQGIAHHCLGRGHGKWQQFSKPRQKSKLPPQQICVLRRSCLPVDPPIFSFVHTGAKQDGFLSESLPLAKSLYIMAGRPRPAAPSADAVEVEANTCNNKKAASAVLKRPY